MTARPAWYVPLLCFAYGLVACQQTPSRIPLGSGEQARAELARTEAKEEQAQQQRRQARLNQLAQSRPPTPAAAAKQETTKPKKPAHPPEAETDRETKADAGSEAGDAGVLGNFDGEYRGTDTMTLEFPGAPEAKQTDPNAILRVEQEDTELTLIIVDSSKGGDLCRVLADATGNRAVIRPGQECFEAATSGMNGTVNNGTAELDGDKITVRFQGEIEIVALSIQGPASYLFEGERKK